MRWPRDSYLRGASDFRPFLPSLSWLAALCGVAATGVFIAGYKGVGFYPFLPLRHFAVGLLLLITLASPLGRLVASRCVLVARPAAALASISYGLYVLHYPILVDSRLSKSWPGLFVAILVLIAASYFADRWLNYRLPRAPRT